MTVTAMNTGAVSRNFIEWKTINWSFHQKVVQQLQARIVKATQAGKWNKVKALQHLLTHSFSGKVLAVKRVTENEGRRTSGVDHQLWFTSERKVTAIDELKHRGYKSLPLKRVYIEKSNGKKRPLGIPTMKDRGMQALYLLALDPVAETVADHNSYGFRKGRSTADAIEQCFAVLAKRQGAYWILEADIKSCFDRIDHEWLMAHIPMDKVILQKWLKAGFIEEKTFHKTAAGTPQGGIISPTLANMTLDGLETGLKAEFCKKKRNELSPRVHVIRYADDYVITSRTKELLEQEVLPWVTTFLKERGLDLSTEKTKITHIDEGFNFLGQNIRKYKGKLLIKPAKESIQSFLSKIRGLIKKHKQATAGELINYLNPIIRGWANYHRHVVSSKIFSKIDALIFRSLWRWCLRRHPNKGKRWIRKKYFGSIGDRNWVFYGSSTNGKGDIVKHWLCYAAKTPIKRHIKVKAIANFYDMKWKSYFYQRLTKTQGHLPKLLQLVKPRS